MNPERLGVHVGQNGQSAQNVYWKEILAVSDNTGLRRRLMLEICSNPYREQCYAVAKIWSNEFGWQLVWSLPETTVPTYLRAEQKQTEAPFLADRTELLNAVRLILS